MKTPKKVPLDELNCVELVPAIWEPSTGGERLAALTAYLTGDGNITKRGKSDVYQAGFYTSVLQDAETMQMDLFELGLDAKVKLKKTKAAHHKDGYQIYLSTAGALIFKDAGAPVGKKTAMEFDVPEWIMNGTLGEKRAYLSALWGAEGTTPSIKSSNRKMGRAPILLMCKLPGGDGTTYFNSLAQLHRDLGVEIEVGRRLGKDGYVTNVISVVAGSVLDFYEKVSYTYACEKSLLAWKMSKYLRAMNHAASIRKQTVIDMVDSGESWAAIGRELGVSRGGAFNLAKLIADGGKPNAGHSFPDFETWLASRWDEDLGLLRLAVTSKKLLEEKREVYNMKVSSHDHSYVLASGANNFNSFETMSGRVYYPFDRGDHVSEKVQFNPKLPIWVGMDFNIDPMSTVIFQPQPDGSIWAVDEIVQFSSNTEEICEELEKRYWRYQKQITVFPDPAGGQRQHARGETDMDILREKGFKKIQYRKKHPAIADRVNSVNRMLRSADGTVRMMISPKCKSLIASFEQTIYKPGTRDVDKSTGTEHSADAAGYCIELKFPMRKPVYGGISI